MWTYSTSSMDTSVVIGKWRREKLMYGTLRSACLLGQQAGNEVSVRQRLPRATDILATRLNCPRNQCSTLTRESPSARTLEKYRSF